MDVSFLNDFITEIILTGVIGFVGYLIKRIIDDKKDKEKWRNEVDHEIHEMRKYIWRLNKTILIVTKMIDKQAVKVHPELNLETENIAKELLTKAVLEDKKEEF